LYLKIQLLPRGKHTPSLMITSHLMLYGEIIAVCSENYKEHINTLCEQILEVLILKFYHT